MTFPPPELIFIALLAMDKIASISNKRMFSCGP